MVKILIGLLAAIVVAYTVFSSAIVGDASVSVTANRERRSAPVACRLRRAGQDAGAVDVLLHSRRSLVGWNARATLFRNAVSRPGSEFIIIKLCLQ